MSLPCSISEVASSLRSQAAASRQARRDADLAAFAQDYAPVYSNMARLVVALNNKSSQSLLSCFRLWISLHHLNHINVKRPGWVELDCQGREALASLTGLAWHRIRVLLAEGDGLWWRQAGSRFYLVRPEKLSAWLAAQALERGISDPFERPVKCYMPLRVLSVGKAEFTAWLFDTWLSVRTGKHGYQARWEDLRLLWSHSDQHIRRWMKLGGVIAEEVKGFIPFNISDEQARQVAYKPAAFGLPAHSEIGRYKQGWCAYFRRANRWHSRSDRRAARPGRAIRITRMLARCADEIRRQVAEGLHIAEVYICNPSALPELQLGEAFGEHLAALAGDCADRGGLSAVAAAVSHQARRGGWRVYPGRRNYVLSPQGHDTAFQRARRRRPQVNLHLRRARSFDGRRWLSFFLFSAGAKP